MLNNKKNKLNKSYYNTTTSKVHLLHILSSLYVLIQRKTLIYQII